MKLNKLGLAATLFITMGLLSACSGAEPNSSSSDSSSTQQSESKKTAGSFKNGNLKTKDFELNFTKNQIIHDNQEKTDGVIVWFDLKNTSKSNKIKPYDIAQLLMAKQSDGNSEFTLQPYSPDFVVENALFPLVDANGQRLTDENKIDDMEQKQDDFQSKWDDSRTAELLPGKTVTNYVSYTLKNRKHPIKITATTMNGDSVSGSYKLSVAE